MEKGLFDKTGKSLQEWINIVKKQQFGKHGEIIKYLKSEHKFTHGFANFVALKSRESDAASFAEEDLIVLQYSKGKEHLQLIYEKLKDVINQLGKDIEFVPKKANVSVRRKKQFALIQPSTKTRIDIGLKLSDTEYTDRLLNSGSFGSMCSHRVQVTEMSQVDDELLEWIKKAYENAC